MTMRSYQSHWNSFNQENLLGFWTEPPPANLDILLFFGIILLLGDSWVYFRWSRESLDSTIMNELFSLIGSSIVLFLPSYDSIISVSATVRLLIDVLFSLFRTTLVYFFSIDGSLLSLKSLFSYPLLKNSIISFIFWMLLLSFQIKNPQ